MRTNGREWMPHTPLTSYGLSHRAHFAANRFFSFAQGFSIH